MCITFLQFSLRKIKVMKLSSNENFKIANDTQSIHIAAKLKLNSTFNNRDDKNTLITLG